jgi:hypothetical protein
MPADDETIAEIIERVTVDAYGDEGFTSFAQAFEDEAGFPLDATVIGIGVEVRSIDFDGDERRCLLAVIARDGETHQGVPAIARHQLTRRDINQVNRTSQAQLPTSTARSTPIATALRLATTQTRDDTNPERRRRIARTKLPLRASAI